MTDHQHREPFAARFGDGASSSSDGQFFHAFGPGRDTGRLNAQYSLKSEFKTYTHPSNCYGSFHSKLIAATAREALHVLDGLSFTTARSRPGSISPMAAA